MTCIVAKCLLIEIAPSLASLTFPPLGGETRQSADEEDEINVPMALSVFRDGVVTHRCLLPLPFSLGWDWLSSSSFVLVLVVLLDVVTLFLLLLLFLFRFF